MRHARGRVRWRAAGRPRAEGKNKKTPETNLMIALCLPRRRIVMRPRKDVAPARTADTSWSICALCQRGEERFVIRKDTICITARVRFIRTFVNWDKADLWPCGYNEHEVGFSGLRLLPQADVGPASWLPARETTLSHSRDGASIMPCGRLRARPANRLGRARPFGGRGPCPRRTQDERLSPPRHGRIGRFLEVHERVVGAAFMFGSGGACERVEISGDPRDGLASEPELRRSGSRSSG